MAVTLAGTPSVYENASATSVVLPYPAGVTAGELLVAHITHSQPTAPSTNPGGWTLIDTQDNSSGAGPSIAMWYKWATGSETGSVTFATSGTAGRVTGIMERWTGVDPTTPIDAPAVGSSSPIQVGYTSPSVSTATTGALILHHVALNASSSQDINTPSGLTKIAGSTGTGRRVLIATEVQPTAGATGTQDWTQTSTTALQWTSSTVPLRAAGGGGGGTTDPGTGGGGTTQPGVSPVLVQRAVGIPATGASTSAHVMIRTTNAVSVRLRVATDSAMTTGVVNGPAVTPGAQGQARVTVSGLEPSTRYYYRIMMTNAEGGEFADTQGTIGRLKTAPNGPASFSFCFGSCNSGYSTSASQAIANRGDDMFFNLGDAYYADGSGTGLSNFRTKLNQWFTSQQMLASTVNMHYLPSDHDGMNNNVNAGNDPTAWNNWNIARSEAAPNPDRYFTFVWGRVRFIMLDDRSFASSPSATDNSSKTYLGATQKQWLKDTITNSPETVIIIGQSGPFVTSASSGGDTWDGFITERNELANFFSASGKKITMLGGDMHALAANDGSSSPGGIVMLHAAPFSQTSSVKGGPYTHGPYQSSSAYGRVTITDTGGTNIAVTYKGYTTDGTERLSLTKNYTVEAAGAPGGGGATGPAVIVSRAELKVAPSTVSVNVTRAEVNVPVSSNDVKIHRAQVVTTGGAADPGPNIRNLGAGYKVKMTAQAPGTPTGYVWDQVSGPTVQLTTSGTGNSEATYNSPFLKANADLVFRVVATYADGSRSGEGITRHEIIRTPDLVINPDLSTTPGQIRLIEEVTVPDTGGGDPGGGTTTPPPAGYQPVGGPAGKTWNIKLSEDFNTLNRQLWTPYWFSEGGTMNNVGTYSSNVAIENGELTLKLESSSRGALMSTNPRDFVAGHSGFEFKYGYVEARIFFPGSGSTCYNWPAFWTDGQQWPQNGEIDIAEPLSGNMTANYHYGLDGVHRQKNSGTIAGNWGGSWHTYAVHREPGKNTHYFDGVKVWEYTTDDAGAMHYLLLNVGNGGTAVYGDASKVRVDYVRVWEEALVTPPPGTNPSGQAVPNSNLTGWNLTLSEDFTRNASLGQFATVYGNIWAAADGQHDTSRNYGRPLATEGIYDSSKTITVHDSMLDIHVYTDANGRPWVANPIPDTGTWGQLYGRFAVRFKSDTVPGYKMAWLLWPTSENWNQGEVDFPEAGLGNNIQGYSHNVNGSPNTNQWVVNTGVNMSDWHTAIIEWTPTSLKFILDDVVYTTTDSAAIPKNPMYWKLQTETNLSATPPPTSAQGHVYIDWVAVWTRA